MKRIVTIMALCGLALSLFAGCASQSGEAVSVESVSMITGLGPVGAADSYAGKVVSGETAELKKDADKTVLEVFVEEGDMVKEGDVLFSYDTEAMQLSLDKLYLEKESYQNTISAAQSEIEELERQRSNASSSQQLSYTLQIDARGADIREAEYNMALKDKEIAAMEAAMEKTEITSPLSGRVMSVGSLDGADPSMGGDMGMNGGDGTTDAFITVMDVSSYRVEGHINELNRGALMEGMPVLVRSRTDADQVWHGVIDSIDWEKPVSNNNPYYYGGGDEMTTSSKYPFYVLLDSTDDLLLGQHVYIEPDFGQDGGSAGLMLPSYYIAGDEQNAWVWAASDREKLEKRSVTLGAYDPDMDEYEIVSGLDYDDYIAFPQEGLSEGMDVVYYDESSFGGGEFYDFGGEEVIYEDIPYDDLPMDEGMIFDDDIPLDEGMIAEGFGG